MSSPKRTGSLLVIFLTVFIDLLGFGIVLPLLPIYADQLVSDAAGWRIGLLMASYSAMQFLFAPLWGRLSDRIGRRPVLMVGLLASVLFYAAFGVATVQGSFWLLFVSRVGAGIAGATIPTAQAYIADCTKPDERAKGMALIGMAFGLGFTFGPLLGFLAVPSEGQPPGPWPGYVAAALSAVALGLAIFLLPESRHAQSASAGRRLLDGEGLRAALSAPSIGLLLLAIFVCIFSFANFETTLSLLIKGDSENGARGQSFNFSWGEVCLTYAFIGVMLSLVQGGVVRRLAGRVSDGRLASTGALLEVLGFGGVLWAISQGSPLLLLSALGVVVAGFSFMQPSLNALLSRRSDPAQQGAVLGVGQSVSALARILGPALGIPMFRFWPQLPYAVAVALMAVGLGLVILADRSGRDFVSQLSPAEKGSD
jgi:MFS transporter, DHA1 family, tetracycline resistance protein